MILNKEIIEKMDIPECEQALVELDKKYKLDKRWQSKDWIHLDDIVNTLLYLEDRIKSIQASETAYNSRMMVLAREAEQQ